MRKQKLIEAITRLLEEAPESVLEWIYYILIPTKSSSPRSGDKPSERKANRA